MSEKYSNIDKWFKEDLYDYAAQPDPKVWDKLEHRLQNKNKMMAWSKPLSILVLLVLGLAATYQIKFSSLPIDIRKRSGQQNLISSNQVKNLSYAIEKIEAQKLLDSKEINVQENESAKAFNIGVAENKMVYNSVLSHKIKNTEYSESYMNKVITAHHMLRNEIKNNAISNRFFDANKSSNFPIGGMDLSSATDHPTAVLEVTNNELEGTSNGTTINHGVEVLNQLPLLKSSLIPAALAEQVLPKLIETNKPLRSKKIRLAELSVTCGIGSSYRTLKNSENSNIENKDYYNQFEQKANSWTTGLLLTFNKSSHWSVTAGLSYQAHKLSSKQPLNSIYAAEGRSEGIYSTSFNSNIISFIPKDISNLSNGDLLSYNVNVIQGKHQLNMPIYLGYRFFLKRIGIQIGGGIQANYILSHTLKIENSPQFFNAYTAESAEKNSQLYWSTICKLQITCPISLQYNGFIGIHFDFANSSANVGKSVQYFPRHQYFTTGISRNF